MTNQIDKLMAMADEYMTQEREGTNGYDARQALQSALEAALDPVDGLDAAFREGVLHAAKKYAAVREQRFTGGDVALYLEMEAAEVDTATPPPLLTEMELKVCLESAKQQWSKNITTSPFIPQFIIWHMQRAIETAVRAQFGVQE